MDAIHQYASFEHLLNIDSEWTSTHSSKSIVWVNLNVFGSASQNERHSIFLYLPGCSPFPFPKQHQDYCICCSWNGVHTMFTGREILKLVNPSNKLTLNQTTAATSKKYHNAKPCPSRSGAIPIKASRSDSKSWEKNLLYQNDMGLKSKPHYHTQATQNRSVRLQFNWPDGLQSTAKYFGHKLCGSCFNHLLLTHCMSHTTILSANNRFPSFQLHGTISFRWIIKHPQTMSFHVLRRQSLQEI